ncbi:MAG: hypothetical protein E7030_02340 [Akkermansiaceae bacterium]|nr:hypothetical protein [Akkermansiaceae bacterium]
MLGEPHVTLQGIPYHLHIFFFPRMAELFWEESKIATISLILITILACFNKKIDRKKIIIIALSSLILAWICASSYLSQCIPTSTSFVPPVFFIIGGCAYIFIELSRKQKIGVLTLSFCYMLWNIIPSAIEAHQYKKYELAWYKEIKTQKDNGIQDIVLEPLSTKPHNKLHLIQCRHLSSDPNAGTNRCLSHHFGVMSIKISTCKTL